MMWQTNSRQELDEDAVEFLSSILPDNDGELLSVELVRRKLGGVGRAIFSGRGYVLEFSRPFRDALSWKLFYRLRLRLGKEVLFEKILPYTLASRVKAVSHCVGVRVLNPPRGLETPHKLQDSPDGGWPD
jgi:hypothetical protein